MPTVTACFLTRNERASIGRAVASVKGVVDEVIVADTHSPDGTAEAAAAAGAVVVPFQWGDDFAAGRDFTISKARGDWVLWMNGSEELAAGSGDVLRGCVARDEAFAFFVRIRRAGATAASAGPEAETADVRLFRRRPDLPRLFVGRLHPHFAPDVVAAVQSQGRQVLPSDLVLLHHADASLPAESKLRFNARLLELELDERPGQLHYLIEYGRTLLALQDPKGEEVLRRAAAHVAGLRDAPSPPAAKVQVLLNYVMNRPADVTPWPLSYADARGLAARWFPDSPNVLWTLAEQSFRRRDYNDAVIHLRRLLELGRTGGYDRSNRFDPRMLGADALLNLGACYVQLDRLDDAEACLVQLAPHPELGAQARQFLDVVHKRRRAGRNA